MNLERKDIVEAGTPFERRQFAILFLWEGYILTDSESVRAFVLSAISQLADEDA